MKRLVLTGACLALLAAPACQQAPQLETRTFAVHNLKPHEVEPLIAPYVYADRATNPGTMSTTESAVTVRETADNLDKIARVLSEYDVARPDVRLRFQLVEADGFTGTDPAIADVEAQLRKLFRFKGYRLVGEAMVQATDGTSVHQSFTGADGRYSVSADVQWANAEALRLSDVNLWVDRAPLLETSVNIRPGQTLVLGTTPKQGSAATLLLTLKAEKTGE